jgi:RNA polymerase sigma factor FliA
VGGERDLTGAPPRATEGGAPSSLHRAVARYSPTKRDDDDLVREYAPLIDRLARSFAQRTGAWDALDDLWTAGAIGLVDAARRFDTAAETRFETFVAHRVRGAMLDELRRLDHLPRRLRERASGLEKARWQLQASLGREPRSEELAAHLKLSLEEVDDLRLITEPALPMEETASVQSVEPDAFERAAQSETRAQVSGAIAALPQRLQLVLALRYDEGLTTREIADILEVSEARVSQLHSAAIAGLQRLMGEDAATVVQETG